MDQENVALKELFSNYKLISPSRLATWIVYTDDWSHYKVFGPNACHSKLQYAYKDHNMDWQPDHLITAMPNHDTIDLRYYDWLLLGPFRAFSDLITLENIKEKWFIHCKNLDKWPANVLYNFCIASRVPIENRRTMAAWEIFLKAGVDPGVAYIAAAEFFKTNYAYDKQFTIMPDKLIPDPWAYKLTGKPYNFDHAWFGETVDYQNILKGTMLTDKFAKCYKDNPTACKPCNVIWGQRGRDSTSVVGKTVEEISLLFGLQGKEVPKPPRNRAEKRKVKFSDGSTMSDGVITAATHPQAEAPPAQQALGGPWAVTIEHQAPVQQAAADIQVENINDVWTVVNANQDAL